MCTSLQLTCEDQSIIYGRTMEFSTDLHNDLVVVPAGIFYQGHSAFDCQNGKQWQNLYGFCGISALNFPLVVDGINTEGLAVGVLFFPNYADYQPVASDPSQTLSCNELAAYILGNFADVAEVKAALPSLNIVGVPFIPGTKPYPLHYTVHDAQGNCLVIEYVGGQLTMFDNPVKVLTNSPPFDWHLTNLKNYINLSVNNVPDMEIDGVNLVGLGQGTGMLGLPGDFTPPSRFIRAVVFSQSSVPSATAQEGIFHMFHLLNQFDIPKGVTRSTGTLTQKIEYTQWSAVGNLADKIYSWRSYKDQSIRSLNLLNDLPTDGKPFWFPLSPEL